MVKSYLIYLQINHLGSTMSSNSTAIRRPKDQTSVNGAPRATGKKISIPAMKHNSKSSHNISNLDSEHLTLWQHPITTLHYFFSEVFIDMISLAKKTLLYKRTVYTTILIVVLFLLSARISWSQQEVS